MNNLASVRQSNVTVDKTYSESTNEILVFLSSAIEAMKNVLPENIEVVLHDLRQPETPIVKIINAHVSARKQGDSLLSAPEENDGFAGMLVKDRCRLKPFSLSGYNCRLKSGKRLKSGSVTYYNDNGEPVAVLAINKII